MSLGAAYNFTADALRGVQSTSVHQRLLDIQNWGSERLALRQKVPELVQKIRERKFVPEAGALHAADYSHLFRKKSRLELALISATVCGIEFCYSAETAFVSPTLLQIGVPVRYMSLIWCLPPIFGFLLVPFLGSCSDRCESRWGRRRPFVMLLAIAIILGLIFVPQGKRLGRLAGDPPPVTKESLRLARQELKILQAKIKSQQTADQILRSSDIDIISANFSSSDRQTAKHGRQKQLEVEPRPSTLHRLGGPVWSASHPANAAAADDADKKSKAQDLYTYLRTAGRKTKVQRQQNLPLVTTTTNTYYVNDPSHQDEEAGYDDYDGEVPQSTLKPLSILGKTTPPATPSDAQTEASETAEDYDDDDEQSHDVYGGDLSSARAPWAIFFSVLGVIMLDFGCDACQSPCRAYLLDVTVPSDHAAGLSTFTVLAGLGGACGYLMGSMHWEQTIAGRALGGQEQTVFLLVAILFFICLFTTLTSFTELPLPELQRRVCVALSALAEDERTEAQRATVAAGAAAASAFNKQRALDERLNRNYGGTGSSSGIAQYNAGAITSAQQNGRSVPGGGVRVTFDPPSNGMAAAAGTFFDNDVAVTTGAFDSYYNFNNEQQHPPGSVEETRSHIPPQNLVSLAGHHPSLMDYLLSIIKMPRALRWLCLTNLFCWMSLVSYSLYFTDFVGQSVFGGNPGAIEGSPRHDLYEAGVRYGALCMSFYSVTCSIYSSMIERAVQKFGAKRVYMGGQAVYSVGMLILAFTRNRFFAMLTSCSAGIMYATLFTMPFLLVGHYHSTGAFQPLVNSTSSPSSSSSARAKAVRRLSHTASQSLNNEDDEDDVEMRQIRGLGTDIAIISSQVFAAQFILSSFLGSLVHAIGSPVVIVVTASLFAFMGTLAATQVSYMDL